MCNQTLEARKHIMEECPVIHKDNGLKISESEIFSNDIKVLRKTAEKIRSVMEIISVPDRTAPQQGRATH